MIKPNWSNLSRLRELIKCFKLVFIYLLYFKFCLKMLYSLSGFSKFKFSLQLDFTS